MCVPAAVYQRTNANAVVWYKAALFQEVSGLTTACFLCEGSSSSMQLVACLHGLVCILLFMQASNTLHAGAAAFPPRSDHADMYWQQINRQASTPLIPDLQQPHASAEWYQHCWQLALALQTCSMIHQSCSNSDQRSSSVYHIRSWTNTRKPLLTCQTSLRPRA